ncbi:hypothetical protein [Halobacterium yunchengense]|uniref:hypothetical protein n=1 Tax=Halobacterium yunchengense TaxID=3108497 RepID=UPI003009A020
MTSPGERDGADGPAGAADAVDAGEPTAGGARADDGPTETVVLNGLDGLVSDRGSVLADDASERALRDAYREVTDAAERDVVAGALDRLAAVQAVEDAERSTTGEESAGGVGEPADRERDDGEPIDDEQVVADVVGRVVDELSARDATFVVDHDAALDLAPSSCAVYEFFGARDPALLAPLADDAATADALERGGEAAAAGDLAAAAGAFEDGVDAAAEAGAAAAGTAARVLAAWAHHRDGDDERALELVRSALLRDGDYWPARVVGVAADHSNPEWFRAGRLTSEAYLRVRASVPDAASVDAALVDGDGAERWLDGSAACFRASSLPAGGHLRLRLRGPPGALPGLHVYYLAVGVVEPESARPRSVEQILVDGPEPAGHAERVRIRVP